MFEVRSKLTADVEPAGHHQLNVALAAVTRGPVGVQGPPFLGLSSFEAAFGARARSGFESRFGGSSPRFQHVFQCGLLVSGLWAEVHPPPDPTDDGGVNPHRAARGITENRGGRLEGGGGGLAPPR